MALLNLQNHREHPSNPLFLVYHFSKLETADYFEELLKINNIFYERDTEDGGGERHLFGVKKVDYTRVEKLNYDALGRFRDKFIPNQWLRYAVLIFTLLLLLFAIVGAMKTR